MNYNGELSWAANSHRSVAKKKKKKSGLGFLSRHDHIIKELTHFKNIRIAGSNCNTIILHNHLNPKAIYSWAEGQWF